MSDHQGFVELSNNDQEELKESESIIIEEQVLESVDQFFMVVTQNEMTVQSEDGNNYTHVEAKIHNHSMFGLTKINNLRNK